MRKEPFPDLDERVRELIRIMHSSGWTIEQLTEAWNRSEKQHQQVVEEVEKEKYEPCPKPVWKDQADLSDLLGIAFKRLEKAADHIEQLEKRIQELEGRLGSYQRKCNDCGRIFDITHGFQALDFCPECLRIRYNKQLEALKND